MKFLGPFGAVALGVLSGTAHAISFRLPTAPKTSYTIDPKKLSLRAAAPLGKAINRDGWKVTCDSHETGHECMKAIDGNQATFWHTNFTSGPRFNLPHFITVDLGSVQNVNGLSVLPRQDGGPNGWIAQHKVWVSADGRNWGVPVAQGTWHADNTEKFSNFETKAVRFVHLRAISEANGKQWTSISELNVFRAAGPPRTNRAGGKWGPTLDFPVVPVAGAVDPVSGKVIVWSAYQFDNSLGGGSTLTATWDPSTGVISQRRVQETNHDMFCPGISMDGNGQLVVTGGNSAPRTSTYDSASGAWAKAGDMNIPRGYQSSATCSDGRVFTVGGSWSGGQFEKHGEIFDPSSRTWENLTDAVVKPMLTADKRGIYRADNHAWLFGWRDGAVFQAGPSTAMNWYYTNGTGNVKSAGVRKSDAGVDKDAMCGTASMFDAVNGKILSAGGSPNYSDDFASKNAHIITIGAPGSPAQSKFASQGLHYPRIFHNSVVLPDGTVFITGGQGFGFPFSDSTPQLVPELYDPQKDVFLQQQPNSIARTYHSVALLLPDATVFSGGGGLCGGCTTNHFDAQIFRPQYLFDKSGRLARRPFISDVSSKTVKAGDTITFNTNVKIKSASLVRYGTSTHTVNTDQRRVPLTPRGSFRNYAYHYSAQLPKDQGVLLAGYWMLFVMNQEGVPSMATTIKVQP